MAKEKENKNQLTKEQENDKEEVEERLTGKTLTTIEYNKEEYESKLDYLKGIDQSKLSQKQQKDVNDTITTLEAAIGWKVPTAGVSILHNMPYLNTNGLLNLTRKPEENYGKLVEISSSPMLDKESNPMIAKQAGDTAIFVGKVKYENVSFKDIGEAGPQNLKAKEFIPFANSMAARRATNRAMRLAVNWGATSFEEMPEVGGAGEKDNDAIRLLTQKEWDSISALVEELEKVTTQEELKAVQAKISRKKYEFNDNQLDVLAKLYNKKSGQLMF